MEPICRRGNRGREDIPSAGDGAENTVLVDSQAERERDLGHIRGNTNTHGDPTSRYGGRELG